MANRIDIEVTGCKGCPFARAWGDSFGHGTNCAIEEHAGEAGGYDVQAFADADGRAPTWCPMRENGVRVDFTGPR